MFRLPDNSGAPPPPEPNRPPSPKVEDHYGRMVSEKTANKPFLAYTKYKAEQERRRAEWEQRKQERAEKLARGESVGPEEPDPDAVRDLGFFDLLKFFVILILAIALAGKFVTDSFTWGYEGKWTNLKTYWPSNQILLSEQRLATFDGTQPGRPIYLAIDGDVYDVSASPHTYGPGGSYHFMAGRDAARAFATGCFKTHQTHDLRGLSEKEMQSIDHWKSFFGNHKTYFKVGRVQHPPIDPKSSIPPPCKAGQGDDDKQGRTKTEEQPVYGPRRKEEL